ncbi:spore coat protein CotH [Corynebacterium poyangense]|uniref:Spore coat protein CotH n=1 Tax=Corynebacterium poyangense TaxID=2684405 RepID=A0A7H0SLP9_9CORY|nr:spore coat protein CotH [Corynebacterium poyangense]
MSATVTIDGTTIENVGLRLKGNSTLQSLKNNSGSGQAGPQNGPGNPPGGAGATQLSFDDPASLPWLISFDEYQEGRGYQGHKEISLRPASNGSLTAMNEALSLDLTSQSGQVTQDYSLASVSVNGGTSAPRLVIDLPDAQWANELGDGVLYKADASGGMDYQGEDPTDYEDGYSQINAEGTYDLEPIMRFLDFVNNSSDEDFHDHLSEYLDVDEFATYLATQTLLSNDDAMDGPGNNYYLWYDVHQGTMQVLSWDLNMTFMGGGQGGPGGGGPSTAGDAGSPQNGNNQGQDNAPNLPGQPGIPGTQGDAPSPPGGDNGATPPDQMQGEKPEGVGPQTKNPDDAKGGGRHTKGSSILKQRFLTDSSFAELYSQAYQSLYQELIASGYAQQALDSITQNAVDAGDTAATDVQAKLAQQLNSISAETPQIQTDNQGALGGQMRDRTSENSEPAQQPAEAV